MRVDRGEVELAGEEEDDGSDRVEAFEAASSALGGLEQAVERLKEAVGLTGLRPGDDALEVATHEGGDFLHRLDLAAHDAGAPVLQRGAHDVDLLAFEDLAQLLLVGPGTSSAHARHAGDERIQVSGRIGLEVGAILQQRPAQALEGLVAALLDAPHLVHRGIGVPDDVELGRW